MSTRIRDVQHVRIAGGPGDYCGWPVMGGIHDFGAGEYAVIFVQGTSAYRTPTDLDHYTIESRSKVVLRRSLDAGETWPDPLAVTVFDNSVPLDNLAPAGEGSREPFDITAPGAILYAGRSMVTGSRVIDVVRVPRERYPVRPIPFVVRSTDKGHTWEKTPILIPLYHLDNGYGFSQYLAMPDGSILMGLPGTTGPDYNKYAIRTELYRSTDHGESWFWANTLYRDPFNETQASYPNLRRLPGGRLACTLGFWKDPRNRVRWMGIMYSEDGGINWTEPRRIGWWGVSPYPLVLRDGRLLLVYAWRQSPPYGIRGMVSEDEGATWSEEFIIRDDGASPDLGYPVALERADGSILTAYYHNVDEQPFLQGGPRHIAGTVFTLAG